MPKFHVEVNATLNVWRDIYVTAPDADAADAQAREQTENAFQDQWLNIGLETNGWTYEQSMAEIDQVIVNPPEDEEK